jgi:predicted ester cyclase
MALEKLQNHLKKFLNALFSGFPDLHVNIEHILAENDLVLVFLNFTGTHRGQYEGLPATNKSVINRSADLYRIENNKIVEHWDVVDRLDLLEKIGAITFKIATKV